MVGTQRQQTHYKASLSKSQGREGWSIIFRHPVRRDEATGKTGKRVRRGLGTRDETEAARLVNRMNQMLADQAYWDIAARPAAEQRFDPRIVEIFYYQIVPEEADFSAVRESFIPLPSSQDSDYRRVLLLGTTGAGKTTLVRQLIGTDPVRERFPSVSTAKTTVADTELVLCEGSYRAIVTFVSRDEVREYLEECISAAVLAAYRQADDAEIVRRLLTHVNQRFRFNYVLGNGPVFNPDDLDDEDEEEIEEDGEEVVSPAELGEIDLHTTNELLKSAVSQLREIARRHGESLRAELDASEDSEEQIIDELFEEELDNLLREDEAFHIVADQLMDEIEQRFDMLDVGTVRRTRQGWPLSWWWEANDRETFIKEVLRFSSNFAPLFGRLLTPLVNGIRVAGPFAPAWSSARLPELVLLDGEGLGHAPESSASVSTKIVGRINDVDAVLLVDNATQPMQAASVAAMKAIVSSGNVAKLLLCFTHFDAVEGDNLPSASAKEEHVLASAENVLTGIGEEFGPSVERALRRRLWEGRFFVGGIQQRLKPTKKRTISQMSSLLDAIDKIVERPELVASRPIYDKVNLVLAVKAAAENFHDAWLPRLGLKVKAGVPKEHWTRVKALTRRLATGWQDEYDTLKPVAELYKQLQDRIYSQIQKPLDWEGSEAGEEEQQQVFNAFADEVSSRLLVLATQRLRTDHVREWQEAYNLHGRGSTFVRAEIIARQVYEKAAPVPEIVPSRDRNKFLHEVIEVVQQAAEKVGVVLR